MKAEEIISVIKEQIENFEQKTEHEEVGSVVRIGDGIATVFGLQNVTYGELVVFDTGVFGIAMNLEESTVGCVMMGDSSGLSEGSIVKRTGKQASVPVGEGLLGRVVDALGSPLDAKGDIESYQARPIEYEAPGVTERKPVDTSLKTGILCIDSMFPIGRGQRELIIGDRQTGKTTIAIDTILNQKGKDVICIYVAIGQKTSTVAKIVSTLTQQGALDYTIVMSAPASDPAPLQYIAPYAGAAMAEHFMYRGKDVLIVYDDLSKHAVAYRTMSLLLHRPPGREAYPGDVFYLHSRLLERSSRLNDENGGGSITALPIIETLAGDSSAYIPTNVISITDGQIYLDNELFFSGIRPAVNVGLSVSRVGSNAQTKIMKQVSGSLRMELAQYRELEIFTQFGADLDKTTTDILSHGKRLVNMLVQPSNRLYEEYEQILILYAASVAIWDELPAAKLSETIRDYLCFVEQKAPKLIVTLKEANELTESLKADMLKISEEFIRQYQQP